MTFKNLIITIILFLATFMVVYFATKIFATSQFEAEMVIYPPNTNINEHLIEAGLSFGGEKEINEYIEVLNSLDVRDSLVKEHDLTSYYGFANAESNNARSISQLNKNIQIDRSMNKSIHIKVLDKDPKIAVALALSIVEIADNHKTQLIKSNIERPYLDAQKAYLNKKKEVEEIEMKLNILSGEGQYNWKNGEETSSSTYELQNMKYEAEFEALQALKINYERFKINFEQDAPKSYIISRPSANAVKQYPNPFKVAFLFSTLFSILYLTVVVFKDKISWS